MKMLQKRIVGREIVLALENNFSSSRASCCQIHFGGLGWRVNSFTEAVEIILIVSFDVVLKSSDDLSGEPIDVLT